MANRFFVSPSPHVHSDNSTVRIMADVLVALLPALVVSVRVFGWNVLAVTATSVAACVLFEFLIQKFVVKGGLTVNNLPPPVPACSMQSTIPRTLPSG